MPPPYDLVFAKEGTPGAGYRPLIVTSVPLTGVSLPWARFWQRLFFGRPYVVDEMKGFPGGKVTATGDDVGGLTI